MCYRVDLGAFTSHKKSRCEAVDIPLPPPHPLHSVLVVTAQSCLYVQCLWTIYFPILANWGRPGVGRRKRRGWHGALLQVIYTNIGGGYSLIFLYNLSVTVMKGCPNSKQLGAAHPTDFSSMDCTTWSGYSCSFPLPLHHVLHHQLSSCGLSCCRLPCCSMLLVHHAPGH